MAEVVSGCISSLSNFSGSCLLDPSQKNLGLTPVITNIKNGVCPIGVYSIFQSCIQSPIFHLYNEATPCYGDYEGFKTCLPGANSHLTKNPMSCYLLSYFVFISNESMLLASSPTIKSIMFLMTQLLRAAENSLCLPICPKHSYTFLGPEETEYEISRYAFSGIHKGVSPLLVGGIGLLATSDPVFGALVGGAQFLVGDFLNFMTQLSTAFPQQRVRNLDRKNALIKCEKEPWVEIKIPKFISTAITNTSKAAFEHFASLKSKATKEALKALNLAWDNTYQIATDALGASSINKLSTSAEILYSALQVACTYTACAFTFIFNQTYHLANFFFTPEAESEEEPLPLSPISASEEAGLEIDRLINMEKKDSGYASPSQASIDPLNTQGKSRWAKDHFEEIEMYRKATNLTNTALSQLGFDASFSSPSASGETFKFILN